MRLIQTQQDITALQDNLYYDLADPQWSAVQINRSGFSI